ncbi:hypothetical protein [Embleya hyalina]|uniref:hypothetical protein n=1 Tax=Embleya hyalina TaxID=516124 RepID=UPI000F832C82|nr:hypothetical protein [Embleya hyalina]
MPDIVREGPNVAPENPDGDDPAFALDPGCPKPADDLADFRHFEHFHWARLRAARGSADVGHRRAITSRPCDTARSP